MNHKALLILNSGSSSVKFQVFSCTNELNILAKGAVSNLGTEPFFSVHKSPALQEQKHYVDKCINHEQAIHMILNWINEQKPQWYIEAVAHRVVHGGTQFTQSVVVDEEIIKNLEQLNPLAPLHQPHNIAAIRIIHKLKPKWIQIACFDTAFHAHHSPLFTCYAIPKSLRELGIRRYGFHGLSYEWAAYILNKEHKDLAKKNVVVAHLGNGASLCALSNGKSIDTTMGLTALDGLPMGTRCGSIDPGAILYLVREGIISPADLEELLYNESGLLGLSNISNDVKTLINQSNKEEAQFALDYFCIKSAQFVSMMAVSLGGIDGLVFTGGIGENSPIIRNKILNRLSFLKPFDTLVIKANEEKIMAMHTLSLI